MSTKKKKMGIIPKILIILLGVLILYILFEFISPRVSLIGKKTEHNVYVALGFHANLYHSFRDDSNTESGFGKDIRIIRGIIDIFDEFNKNGIDAKAVWDIENLFTLEEFLPEYAPDIIKDINRGIKENGDEVIIMSYNNGLASAMTKDEFRYSIEKAITNEWGSGVQDLFGEYSPIVRPQEMMATPGNYDLYNDMGIDTICLYYSAITFDTFRVFIPQLTLEQAHNPLMYKNPNTGEQIRVIPTYNIGDLIENKNLNEWAEMLHREQLRGNIDNDVLIFINFDADNEYWTGMNLPDIVKWLPNAGGLNQLIGDVSKLEYVKFTTLKEYIDTHDTVKDIYFGQDTADGCFNGYSSWSEKSYNSSTYTEIVNNRRQHSFINKIFIEDIKSKIPDSIQTHLDKSYKERMRLLSTTNFGLAAPFLARGREIRIKEIIDNMKLYSDKATKGTLEYVKHKYLKDIILPELDNTELDFIENFILANLEYENNIMGSFFSIPVKIDDINNIDFYIYDENGKQKNCKVYMINDINNEYKNIKVYSPINEMNDMKVYYLYKGPKKQSNVNKKRTTFASNETLRNNQIKVTINKTTKEITKVAFNGTNQLDNDSLISKIRYQDQIYKADIDKISVLNDGSHGVASVKMEGSFPIQLRENEQFNKLANKYSNKIKYIFTLIDDLPFLFVDVEIHYPDTQRDNFIKPTSTRLIRKIDKNWKEVAPLELKYLFKANKERPFKILKRNFLGVQSSYQVDYFIHSDKNLNLSNINNHITSSYVGLTNGYNGIVIGMDNTISSNFAFCPMKMTYNKSDETFSMMLNPFGSYYGEQYYQPTWGNGIGFDMTLAQGEQFSPSAPSYNGYRDKFSVVISFFEGNEIPLNIKRSLVLFADPPYVISNKDFDNDEIFDKKSNSEPVKGFFAKYKEDEGVYFYWEKPEIEPELYEIRCEVFQNKESDESNKTKEKAIYYVDGSKTRFLAKEFIDGEDFIKGEKYFASIIAQYNTDKMYNNPIDTESTDDFIIEDWFSKSKGSGIPLILQLRVLLLTLKSFID